MLSCCRSCCREKDIALREIKQGVPVVDCAEGGKALDFSRNAPAKPERTRESIRYYNDVTGQRGCINKKNPEFGR